MDVERLLKLEESPSRPSPSSTLLAMFLLIACFVFLGFLLYAAQFSGSLRWFLVLASLALAALVLAWQVSRRSKDPIPLLQGPWTGQLRPGELASLAAAVRRADHGLPYSQMAVSSRARDAFEEHIRLSLGLSFESMRAVQRDPGAARSVLHDDRLTDFMVLRTSSADERYRWVRDARLRNGFDAELRDVLDRMEAWR